MLFQEAWESVASEGVRAVIRRVEPTEDHEELVSRVAKTLYLRSRFVFEVEEDLFHGRRQLSTMETEIWLTETCARYVRLCKRRQHLLSAANTRLPESATRSLPESMENSVRDKGGVASLKRKFARAYEVEGNWFEDMDDCPNSWQLRFLQ